MFEGHVLLGPEEFLPGQQQEVWRRLVLSETPKGIALAMKLSPKTVEYHRASLIRRLGINNDARNCALLTREAIATGLIE